jgi:hypothetical protein
MRIRSVSDKAAGRVSAFSTFENRLQQGGYARDPAIDVCIYAKTAFLLCQGGNLAASLVWLDLLAPQRNATLSTLCTSSGRLSLHASLDLTGHGKESLFDIGRSLGRSFEKFNSEAISKFLSLLSGNNALARQIGLVTD